MHSILWLLRYDLRTMLHANHPPASSEHWATEHSESLVTVIVGQLVAVGHLACFVCAKDVPVDALVYYHLLVLVLQLADVEVELVLQLESLSLLARRQILIWLVQIPTFRFKIYFLVLDPLDRILDDLVAFLARNL